MQFVGRVLRAALLALLYASSPSALTAPDRSGIPITYEQLVQIADLNVAFGIGASNDYAGPAVSPDQRYLAVEVRRASLQTDSIQIRWLVLDLQTSRAIDVGGGGEPIQDTWLGRTNGNSIPETPIWSSDSQWIVYRKQVDGEIQLWRSHRHGRQERLTKALGDVERFQWSNDKKKLIYVVGEPRHVMREARALEAARGYLYDRRFNPMYSRSPLRISADSGQGTHSLRALDLAKRIDRLADPEESVDLERDATSELASANVHWYRKAADSPASAWLEDRRSDRNTGVKYPLTAVHSWSDDRKDPVPCINTLCTGDMKGFWISKNGQSVYFLRWVGPYQYGPMSLNRWDVRAGSVTEILRTSDLLERCAYLQDRLICARESTTLPRHIVSVNVLTGVIKVLLNLNPELSGLNPANVVELNWKDEHGAAGFGHLVKPRGYVVGRRYPLVIVQYRSRGFLRGGSGDEYPIHVLADKGFAVLSFHRPDNEDVFRNAKSWDEVRKIRWEDFADRRSVLSVLNAGIDLLDRMGIIDPTLVGITGFSDGGETTSFALVQCPRRFSAAAVSWTYWNPILFYVGGPMEQQSIEQIGFGNPASANSLRRWQQISVALNAHAIETPLLIQVSDSELMPETEVFANWVGAGKPVEMYVFENEYHVKSSPIHRYSVYKRSVQWFQFWLRQVEESDPLDPTQYQRWESFSRNKKGSITSSAQSSCPTR